MTETIAWCKIHGSRQHTRSDVCEHAHLLWEAGQAYLLEGKTCDFVDAQVRRVSDG